MQVPDSGRPKRISLHISVSSDSTTGIDNSRLFIWLISLVVSIKGDTLHLVLSGPVRSGHLLSSCQGRSGITDIGTKYFVTNDKNTYAS